jgi:cell division protein FtsW
MTAFSRTDQSVVARWWWTVDRWSIIAIATIIGIGAVLMLAASPAVATRIGLDSFHFVKRQIALLPPALLLMFVVSLLPPRQVRRLAAVGFLIGMALLVMTLFWGSEIKGARRWITLAGLGLQPSEFVKPCFAVVAAWMFSEQRKGEGFPGDLLSIAFFLCIVALLLMQPDLGQTVVISAIWFTEYFLAGLPLAFVVLLALMAGGVLVGAYYLFPHVASRIDRFLDPATGDTFQVDRGLEAFANGGLWGRGPGEGVIKSVIPDAHADFIFAVAGEEFGLIACLIIVALFCFVLMRGFGRLLQESNLFVLLAGVGLLVQFGLQAIINMASTLHLMPTKGMTLPFVSYGGSSVLAIALGMGMLLALTRRRGPRLEGRE